MPAAYSTTCDVRKQDQLLQTSINLWKFITLTALADRGDNSYIENQENFVIGRWGGRIEQWHLAVIQIETCICELCIFNFITSLFAFSFLNLAAMWLFVANAGADINMRRRGAYLVRAGRVSLLCKGEKPIKKREKDNNTSFRRLSTLVFWESSDNPWLVSYPQRRETGQPLCFESLHVIAASSH